MALLSDKLAETISIELSKSSETQKLNELEKLVAEMKKAGLIKQPVYDLPLVDTIGKTYYSSTNKRK